jgi:hypothetical protein
MEWSNVSAPFVGVVGVSCLLAGFVAKPFVEVIVKTLTERGIDRIWPKKTKAIDPGAMELGGSRDEVMRYRVAVLNRSERLPDAEVVKVVTAIQRQIHRDLAPTWDVDADLKCIPRGNSPPRGHWWIELTDKIDKNGALTTYEPTPEGFPRGILNLGSIANIGMSWSACASHRILEMLVDPAGNLAAVAGRDGTRVVALQIADPVQADTYVIDGVTVANFVFPAWFDSRRPPGSAQFDQLRLLQRPLQVRPTGYIRQLQGDGMTWRALPSGRS